MELRLTINLSLRLHDHLDLVHDILIVGLLIELVCEHCLQHGYQLLLNHHIKHKQTNPYWVSSWTASWCIQSRVSPWAHPWTPCPRLQTFSRCHTRASNSHWEGRSLYKGRIQHHPCEICCCRGRNSRRRKGNYLRTFWHTFSQNERLQGRGRSEWGRNQSSIICRDPCGLLGCSLI